MPISYTTNAAVSNSEIRDQMLGWLSDYYPKGALNTNLYYLISMFADILTDVDNEIDLTILDMGIDEARDTALYKNFGELFELSLKTNLQWGWDDYRFYLKILLEAFTLYGSTAFGMRRVIQVATGISPYLLEHYKYAGWILGEHVLGATVVVQTGNYVWNSVASPILDNITIKDVFATQMSDVWICGTDTATVPDTAKVFRNTDFSHHWIDYTPTLTVPALTATSLNGVHANNKQNTWFCGEDVGPNGVVFKHNTQTGWILSRTEVGAIFNSIWSYTDSKVWAVGDGGLIKYWNGIAWLTQVSGTGSDFYAIHGYNDSNIYAVGSSNAIRKWDGANWLIKNTPLLINWRGVYAVSATEVWVCGINGWVAYSTDSGTTWNYPAFFFTILDDLYDIHVTPDGYTIRIVGENGTIYKSIDGGVNWFTETNQSTGVDFSGLWISKNSKMGYVVGNKGTILRDNGQSLGYTIHNKLFNLGTIATLNLLTDLNLSGSTISAALKLAFSNAGYPLSSNAVRKIVTTNFEWYIVDTDRTFRILSEYTEINVYPPEDIVYNNGDLIYSAILESRYGRRNTVDVVVWNIKDYPLIQKMITDMKPAHIKTYTVHEWPFILDYYYDAYYEDIYTGGGNLLSFLAQVNENVVVINGRRYGNEMSRITYGDDEVNIPQLD
jgi:photosystem II stability/assembly factor-like uncharacterized protein